MQKWLLHSTTTTTGTDKKDLKTNKAKTGNLVKNN